MRINVEPLRVSLSKIAPLERWDASWTDVGPKVCWKFFRPDPRQVTGLLQTIGSFHGHSHWHLIENCLEGGTGPVFLSLLRRPTELSSIPPTAQISEADAARDLAALANEIEARLDLTSVKPKPFSEALLTREGLRKSPGPYQDFEEGGQRLAFLIVDPGTSEIFEPRETDIMLHFEPTPDEMTAVWGDIVGANLAQRDFESLTESEATRIARDFPILWKLSEYYEDAYLTPAEAEVLLRECVALDNIVFSNKGIRGLDKISRIARWASDKHYGVLFEAP